MTSMKEYNCTVLGDVLWDVVVSTEYAQPVYGGTRHCHFAGIFPGGMGNVATALSHLGIRVSFIGKAGKDWLGELYLKNLKGNNISTCVYISDYLPTGVVTVFVDEKGERSFLVFRGANDDLQPKQVEKARLIEKSNYLFLSRLSLVSSPQRDAVYRAAELAREQGVKIIFDPGAHNLIASETTVFPKLLYLADILCANLEEAKVITGKTKMQEIITQVSGRFHFVALKLGSKGCVLINKGKTVNVPGYKVKCVDTTGAGDAFAAALIYGLNEGLPLERIGRLANWFAAQVTRGYGARNFPPKARIERFLARQLSSA